MSSSAPKISRFLIVLIIFVFSFAGLYGQETGSKQKKKRETRVDTEKVQDKSNAYFEGDFLRYEDYVYDKSIKTVLFHREGWEITPPIILYKSNERLVLSFDDLDGDYKSWQYTVVHCDAYWKPSDLWQNEYLEGFTNDYIREYRFSFNTLQPFTHYSIILPNDNLKFTLPGNYLLKIYPDGNPGKPIITRRFMVVDPKVKVSGKVKRAGNIDQYFSHHEIPFSVHHTSYPIAEPYRDLKVVVLQNHRWDNALWGMKPLMLRNDELDYQYTDGSNTFEAGNEFRYFDIKSLRYNSERVRFIENRADGYHVTLFPDARRTNKVYVTYSEINGQMLIKTEDAQNTSTEAEYVWVDFYIPLESPFTDGSVYVMGALTDWQFRSTSGADGNEPYGRMKYNFARQGYETRLYLKQGYYNYLYAFLPNGKTKAELFRLEGSLYETRNSYTVLVYHREPGTRFDRLIAAEVIEN
ncbi:MAG: DUF5103 domain-containing protein [Lentimicrobium sp.]|nr:DUF5103 domain-containing protein [Lentimicrobium sp.]